MAHSIYADEMTATFKYGHPLWEPDSDREVCIADVGYIRRGQFCRLFNASLPEGDPANQEFGEPDGYIPLHVGAIQELTPHPPGVMASRSVSNQGTSIGFNQSILQAGGAFNFSCSKNQGAILIINSEAYRKDALRTGAFKNYMKMHSESWLKLANNESNSRDISLSDLVFVTGRDLTADWAMASFTERSLSGGISFNAGFPTLGSAQFSIWGEWQQLSSIHSHCGPRIPRARASRAITGPETTQNTFVNVCAADLNRYNQCIFLRGFRVLGRTEYTRRKILIRARSSSGGLDEVAKPWFSRSTSSSEHSDTSSLDRGRSSSEGSRSKNHSLLVNSPTQDRSELDEILSMSNYLQDRAPIEALLEYMLEKSDAASIAIAHDDDLAQILKVHDVGESVDFDALFRTIDVPVYVDPDGVGTIREYDTYDISDPQDESSQTDLPSPLPLSASGQSSPTMTPTGTPRVQEVQLFMEKQRLKEATFTATPVEPQQVARTGGSSTRRRKSAEAPHTVAYHAEQEHIRTEIDALQARLAKVQDKISLTTKTGRGADRRNTLRAELDALRDQQLKQRTDRDATSTELRTVEEEMRRMIQNLRNVSKKLPARTVEEVDAQIKALERRVDTGSLSLAEEKATLRQTSQLRRSRSAVENSQALQTDIDAHRARAETLRKRRGTGLADTTSRMDAVRKEMEVLRQDSDAAFAERHSLYDERTQLQTQLSKLHEQRRQSTERFRAECEEHRRQANEDRALAAAKARAERAMQEERRRVLAQERLLEKARAPAFAAEIQDCRSLLEYFSGTNKASSSPTFSPTAQTKHDLRQPTDNHPEAWAGWVPMKKVEEASYFVGGKGKNKAKKGERKGATSMASGSAKVSVPIGILSTLVSLSIDPPMVAADIPRTTEVLHTKLQWYEANQATATEENVARAKADLERIKPPMRNNLVSPAS